MDSKNLKNFRPMTILSVIPRSISYAKIFFDYVAFNKKFVIPFVGASAFSGRILIALMNGIPEPRVDLL